MKLPSPKLLFKASAPADPRQFIGRTIEIPVFVWMDGGRIKIGEKRVTIATICGSRVYPNFFEINGDHLIGMLRFYAQIHGAKDITEDDMQKFETMEIEAEKMPEKLNG